jgi:hypothetical protein
MKAFQQLVEGTGPAVAPYITEEVQDLLHRCAVRWCCLLKWPCCDGLMLKLCTSSPKGPVSTRVWWQQRVCAPGPPHAALQ